MQQARLLKLADQQGATTLWQEIEREIVDQAPVVPLVNNPPVQLVSNRVGNYQDHPQWVVLIDQLWVR